MRKKKGLRGAIFALCLSLMMPSGASFAAEQSVRVTLPDFAVTFNGNTIENQYREYPLLMYKDITYFPMTYYDSRLLGMETKWTSEEGLAIVKASVASSYEPYATTRKNSSSYKATVPAFGITINGKTIDNSQEPYPLLTFNDVTYFPLTWKFAHDEFGWEYRWDDTEGLAIRSGNPQVQTVNLPPSVGENDVAVFKGYYYFTETEGDTNRVYRAPMDNTSAKELVYDYKLDTGYGMNKRLNFQIRNNELWFSYHIGGATMGSDIYCKVDDNGKAAVDHRESGMASVEHRGYLDFKNSPNGTLIINQSVPPHGNNLKLVSPGQEEKDGKTIGDPNLIYGWHITAGGGYAFGTDRSTTIVGDEAYVLASSYPAEPIDLNKIYKINLSTNETVKIVNSEVSRFKIINNKLYYVKDADGALYSSDLNGANEQKKSDHQAVNWFEMDGNVYYTDSYENGQFHLYKTEPSGEDALVFGEPLESVQFVKGRIICRIAAGGDYGVKIFDKSGRLELAVADQVANVFAYDDAILIMSAKDKSIKLIK